MSDRQSREDETVDATRRTYLAAERTYLAWWREGGFWPPGAAVLAVLAVFGVILSIGTIALVLFEL